MTVQTIQIHQDEKSSFPFSMIEGMMPFFPYIAAMAWMLVLVAFLYGLLVISPAQATFLSDAKAVREGAAAGSAFVNANVSIQTVKAWVPQLKFLGLGLGLLAIVMALGIIAKNLRKMGFVILSHIPAGMRPPVPARPLRVRAFQISAVMGIMLLMIVLIIGVVLAITVVPGYWNHSIVNELNPAQPGSVLLQQAAIVQSYSFWLNPLRMIGMALLFTAITIALTVIIGTLRLQSKMLVEFYNRAVGAA